MAFFKKQQGSQLTFSGERKQEKRKEKKRKQVVSSIGTFLACVLYIFNYIKSAYEMEAVLYWPPANYSCSLFFNCLPITASRATVIISTSEVPDMTYL